MAEAPMPGGLPPAAVATWADAELAESTTLSGIAGSLKAYNQESDEAENTQRANEPGVYRSLANRMNAAGGLTTGGNTRGKESQYRVFSERRQSRENAKLRREAKAGEERSAAENAGKAGRNKAVAEGEEYQREHPAAAPAAVTAPAPPAAAGTTASGTPAAGTTSGPGPVKVGYAGQGMAPAPPGYKWVKMPGGSYNLKKV